jgi:hypothetical protein
VWFGRQGYGDEWLGWRMRGQIVIRKNFSGLLAFFVFKALFPRNIRQRVCLLNLTIRTCQIRSENKDGADKTSERRDFRTHRSISFSVHNHLS